MFPVPCFVFKPWYSVLHRTHYIAEASTELFIWLMSNFISVWISSTFPLLIEIYLHILNCLCFAFHLCFPFTVSESIKEGAVTLAASGSLSWAGWSEGLLFRIPAGRRQGLPSWGSGQKQSNVKRLHWWVHTRLIHTRQVNRSEPLWFEKLEKMVLYPRKCKGLYSGLPFHLSLALVLNQGMPRRESFCTLQCYPLIFPRDSGLYHWERWPQLESWGPTPVEVTTHSEKCKSSFLEGERKRSVWLPFQKALPAECWESGHGHY